MKTLYLECNMGAAGDMLAAALLALHPHPEEMLTKLNALQIPHTTFSLQSVTRCGIQGAHLSVTVHGEEEHSHDVSSVHPAETPETHAHHHHHHHHTGMEEIAHIISHLEIPETVKQDVLAVYEEIAQAESHAHGKPVSQIHFHEVGTMDAIADITAVCWLIRELAPEQIAASPVHVGSGQVRCAHGILPVPAPATAYLLQGIPTYGGAIQGELCTPTGAALLKHFVTQFGEQPVMRVEKIGYGMGTKEFEQANCVRAMIGQTDMQKEHIVSLSCNLDDMTAEEIGFAMEQLFAAGAADVFTTAIGMKKNRPGTLLTCMCRLEDRERLLQQIFQHTTTLGVRESICNRYVLHRTEQAQETAYGVIHVKRADGWNVSREKMEYEDLTRIARQQGMSLQEVKKQILSAQKDNA